MIASLRFCVSGSNRRFLPERDYVTFGSLLSQFRLSSVCLSVCNVGAPYSGGWSFGQYFFTAMYLGHPLTSVQNFTGISSPDELLYSSVKVIFRTFLYEKIKFCDLTTIPLQHKISDSYWQTDTIAATAWQLRWYGGLVVKCRTRNREVAGSTLTRSTASNLED